MFSATPQQLTLAHLVLGAFGGHLTGQAVLPNYRELRFDGSLSAFNVRELSALFSNRPLPWAAVASGRIHIEAPLDRRSQNFCNRKQNADRSGCGWYSNLR